MDPVSKRRMYLSEIVPPGPRAGDRAERVRTRLLSQVDERRSPRTRKAARGGMAAAHSVTVLQAGADRAKPIGFLQIKGRKDLADAYRISGTGSVG
jgi:hypothetical protein